MTLDTQAPSLVARFNALMAELDEAVAAAGGWRDQLDPAWRADWMDRKRQLIADIEARGAVNS